MRFTHYFCNVCLEFNVYLTSGSRRHRIMARATNTVLPDETPVNSCEIIVRPQKYIHLFL